MIFVIEALRRRSSSLSSRPFLLSRADEVIE